MANTSGTLWAGLALRRMRAAADPDAAPRPVALPAAWDDGGWSEAVLGDGPGGRDNAVVQDGAGMALAALGAGQGAVSLPRLAEGWIGRLLARGRRLSLLPPEAEAPLAEALRALLLSRRGAPGAATWRHDPKAEPRFVLNLPAFLDDAGGFDIRTYTAAVATAIQALDILAGGKAPHLRLGFADLSGLLAGLGLAYDSDAGRQVAACLAALTRGAAEGSSGDLALRLGAREPASLLWPAPPPSCAVPGLALAAQQALEAAGRCGGLRHAGLLALTPPDATEALLGAETGGLAPAHGPTHFVRTAGGGVVERPTRAARRAMALHGPGAAALLAPVPAAARLAMEAVVRPYLHAATPVPAAMPAPARPLPPPRPATARGQVWRVTLAGHRVTLHTTEAADGSLAGIGLAMARDGAAFRGVLDSLLTVVNLGLARGLPVSDYVAALAYNRGGPAGTVEGDPDIRRATSVLDWAFRRIAITYLGGDEARQLWPDPSEEDCAAEAGPAPAPRPATPQLPLDLPARPSPAARRGTLRLVG